jgi:hypothetical protein
MQVLLRDVTEAEGAARVFSRWEHVLEGSPGRLHRQQGFWMDPSPIWGVFVTREHVRHNKSGSLDARLC